MWGIMYKTKVFYDDDDFTMKIEELNGELFVHLTLHKATRTILDRVLRTWGELKARAWLDGYDTISTYTQDDRMFKFFPFSKYMGEVDWNGKQYKVGTWALN